MSERRVVFGGLVAAFVVAGAASFATGGPTVLGTTPLGVAIYAGVGIAAPQFLLARRTASTPRVGVAVLATVVTAAALLTGLAGTGLAERWSVAVTDLLAVVVLGIALGTTARQVREGYRSESQ